MNYVNIIGGGLAGSEAAYFIARRGYQVRLYEMRPVKNTPVHQTGDLAELVCSNSLKSELEDTAQGLLKQEMRLLGSLLLSCADEVRVPAGSALAVDRKLFSEMVTERINSMANIEIIREEVTEIPAQGIAIIATGPLTSDALAKKLQDLSGKENLYFYDAVAPSITFESIDLDKVFKASRYGKGTDDYYNCPMNREEYDLFYSKLVEADTFQGHSIDKQMVFDGCMPIEVMAGRGIDTMRYGPMRPVGLKAPGSQEQHYAVVQLRQEDKDGQVFGLVGFQTRLKWREQQEVFRLIPGLEKAEFVRYGVMHRNTYINSPLVLQPTLQFKTMPGLLLAGQITGVEGYMESAATGLIAGLNALRILQQEEPVVPSRFTMIGALLDFISNSESKSFQPINANFGILPPLETRIKDKKARYKSYVGRSVREMRKFSELFPI
ncbi:trna:m(5)u-54 mtase gid [hydrocarbon metagenome]|uniref:Trna:m(5)u-54 mtase gid n=1 Tax=hydrocarbon metagenome TaxID=938273 RepID=A0A0W8E4M1_9ZZZZ